MNRLKEIIVSGKPPGFGSHARDPECADVAVPRAFKQLEEQHSAQKIAKDAGYSVSTIKRTWGI